MTSERRVAEYYGALLPASFAGVRFSVNEADIQGGYNAASEMQVGRGTRARGIAPAQETFPIKGYLTGPDALNRSRALKRALNAGEGQLVHPWHGRVQCLPVRWSIRFASENFEAAIVDIDFHATELAENADRGDTPQTADEALAAMTQQGRAFARETKASDQLETMRAALILEPPGKAGEEYTEQATGALLRSEAAPSSQVPRAIQRIGVSTRRAERGDISASDVVALEAEIITIADRNDSPALLSLLETFQLFIGTSGAGILANIAAGERRNLQAIAVASGAPLDTLAARNRDAIRLWFATGEVRL